MNSPFGNRGEICKNYGWTLDYLLWGIPWVVVQTMLADAARVEELPQTDPDSGYDDEYEKKGSAKTVIHRELKSKDDIKNYIKGII